MSGEDPAPDADVTAAELALGLLAGEERAAALDRASTDAGFAAEVAWWRGRAALLFGDGLPLGSLWPAILARLPKADDGRAVRRAVTVWRSVAGVATMAALGMAVLLFQRPEPQAPAVPAVAVPASTAPTLVATLESSDRAAAVAVVFYASQGSVIATPVRTRAVPHAAELWLVPATGTPVSLGLLSEDRATERAIGAAVARLLRQGATLAISAEPEGGSRTGQPTGPVVLTGKLARNADGTVIDRRSPPKET